MRWTHVSATCVGARRCPWMTAARSIADAMPPLLPPHLPSTHPRPAPACLAGLYKEARTLFVRRLKEYGLWDKFLPSGG